MKKIGTQKIQGSVVDSLKREILCGNIPGGTEMTQNELAQSLGVSRMPVREALILLEYHGLIERLPNNHVKVVELTEAYIRQIFRLYAHLEYELLMSLIEKGVFDWKKNVFAEDSETEFHEFLYEQEPYALQKKLMETLQQIYLSYALESRFYHREQSSAVINQILEVAAQMQKRQEKENVNEKQIRELLQQYFEELGTAIIKERSAHVRIETN